MKEIDKDTSGGIGVASVVLSVGISLIVGQWIPFWPCVGLGLILFIACIFVLAAVLD